MNEGALPVHLLRTSYRFFNLCVKLIAGKQAYSIYLNYGDSSSPRGKLKQAAFAQKPSWFTLSLSKATVQLLA